MGMILPSNHLNTHDFHDTNPILAMSNHWLPPHHQHREVVWWERSSLGTARHCIVIVNRSSANQASLNSASFDAKQREKVVVIPVLGSFWWHLQDICKGSQASTCCYLEDIGRFKIIVTCTSQVIPRLTMDLCFNSARHKVFIFFAFFCHTKELPGCSH